MHSGFRYNQGGAAAHRAPEDYPRWLAVWLRALALLLRGRCPASRLVWAEDAAAETLLRGFPALLAAPAPLFGALPDLVPGLCRLAAAGRDEETLLASVRQLERRSGERFDWDAFFAACEKGNRRARRLDALSERLLSRRPASVELHSAHAALSSLAKNRKGSGS